MSDPSGTGQGSTAPQTDEDFARWLVEAAERLRAGEEPDAEAAAHPEWADRLEQLLPTIRAVERASGLNAPTTVGDFQTLREIGRGGMGVVYEAIQLSLGRRVALKVLPSIHADDPRRLRRFRIEAQAAAALQHPNIVPVYLVGTQCGLPYYAMQLIEGRSLGEVLAECRDTRAPLPPRTVADLGRQAALALAAAHEQGVVHRDVKPSNLLVNPAGWLWVADFGLALLQQSEGATATSPMLGTLRYMSPEQVLGERGVVDHRVDVYALGVTLYELLTLRPVFDSEDRVDLPRRIIEEEPRPLRRIERSVPRDLETIVLKAMAKVPTDRYATAGALAGDLSRFLDDRPILARPPSIPQRVGRWSRRHRAAVSAIAALALITILSMGCALAWRNGLLRQHNHELSKALGRAERNERLTRRYAYATQIRLAQQALSAGHVEYAQDILAGLSAPPGQEDPRGFEWSVLWEAAQRDVSSLARHHGSVYGLAVTPDGRTLASAGEDGDLVLWDLVDGRERVRRRAHAHAAHWLRISPDGRLIATASSPNLEAERREVALWDATTGAELGRVEGPSEIILDLVFAPEGREITAVLRAHNRSSSRALVWDTARRLAPVTRPGLAEGIANVAYDPAGRLLATWGHSGSMTISERATGRTVQHYPISCPCTSLAFTHDGKKIAWGTVHGIQALSVESGQIERAFPMANPTKLEFTPDDQRIAGHVTKGDIFICCFDKPNGLAMNKVHSNLYPGPIHDSTLSPDGGLTAVSGFKLAPTILDTRTGQIVAELKRRTADVRRLAFAQDGRSLFLAYDDGRVCSWHFVARPERSVEISGHKAEIWALGYASRNATLITASDDHTIKLWNSDTGDCIRTLDGHQALVSSLALSADGDLLATAAFDNTVRLWDLPDGRPRSILRGHTASVRAVAFSPDGRTLASGGSDSGIRLWNPTTGSLVRILQGHTRRLRALAFDPRGRYLVSCGDDRILRVLETLTWDLRVALDRTTPGGSLAFSPDGSLLVAGDDQGGITVWDVGPWKERTFARINEAPVWGLAFSPDGRTLAAACGDGKVRLWDPITGELLLALEGHKTRVNAVAFAPSGNTLASGSHDGVIRLWGGQAR